VLHEASNAVEDEFIEVEAIQPQAFCRNIKKLPLVSFHLTRLCKFSSSRDALAKMPTDKHKFVKNEL
jgi:hypothetical protein